VIGGGLAHRGPIRQDDDAEFFAAQLSHDLSGM
jgi:hypothetical protein